MAITAKTRRLANELRAELVRVTDGHQRAMLDAWVRAWDEVAPDLRDTLEQIIREAKGGAVSHGALLRNARLRRSLAHIADRLDRLTRDAGVQVTGDLRGLIDAAGEAQAAIIASQLPGVGQDLVDLDAWSRVDTRQIDAIVRRTTEQITAAHYPISERAYAAVQRELTRGIASGANPRVTARRMVARAEGPFNGGLGRALTIARTETLDAYREASRLSQVEHADVLDGWQWQASLGKRTCPACLSMSGQVFPLSTPGPEGHQNCRCARLPVVKSWRDLGFDVDEPESVLPSSSDYFEGLTAAEQRDILGDTGYDAWKRGDWPMSQWAVKRETPGWRDSYVVARPPRPSSGSRAGRTRVA